MPSILRIATPTRNAMLSAMVAAMDGGPAAGTIKFYTGAQPANGDAALSGNTLLGTLPLSDPSANVAAGTLTFNVITEDSAADNSGVAAWARIQDSTGNNVADVNVGTADATIIMTTVNIVAGGPIRIQSGSFSIPAA